MRTTPLSRVNPATMKGPGDFDPPEYDEHMCPECEDGVLVERDLGVGCSSCTYYDEPDYESMAEDRWGEGWRGRW